MPSREAEAVFAAPSKAVGEPRPSVVAEPREQAAEAHPVTQMAHMFAYNT